MSAEAPELLWEARDGVARVTLNRPEKRNALSLALLEAAEERLTALEHNPTVRVVVLAASGSVFCAGHDLSEMLGRTEAEYQELFALCSKVMLHLRRLPQPVIARVHGMATAAGCQLVAACDLAVASESASFATPGVKIGLFCSTPMVPLVRAIPAKPALEMLLTGRPISARQALAWGLVNRVVPGEQLDAAVQEFVDAIHAVSPEAIRLGKAAFYEQRDLDEATAYLKATEVMTCNALHAEAQEGMRAFLEKRPPRWLRG
jgi:enoyl-CoA hydratase/carnithine racemase